jgi:hypothetical protein
MTSKPITRHQFENMLMATRGAQFVKLRTVTEVRIPGGIKTLNGRVLKCADVVVQIGVNYQNAVNNQLRREGSSLEFVAQPRKWGTRVRHADGRLTPFVEHNGAAYLEAKIVNPLVHMYFLERDGKAMPIAAELVEPLLPDTRAGARATQGTESPVILRDYKLESIRQVTMGGETYDLIG